MTTADTGLAELLGITPGQSVGEIGWDDDCDEELRQSIESLTGRKLLDEDAAEAVDAVLLWCREHDGDPTDGLMDAVTGLKDGGCIWLVTPKAGRAEFIEPSDVEEAAQRAGLSQVSSLPASGGWTGTKFVRLTR